MRDLEIEDLLKPMPKKKKNSGDKGKRVERELAKILNNRFGGGFSRSVGSGNRWGQVANMPKHAADTFAGDLVCPENFRFTLESKGGYDDIDLNGAFVGGSAQIDAFLKQAEFQGSETGRLPLLVWKKNRKPWLAFVKTGDLPHLEWTYRLIYGDWSAVALNDLLGLPDKWFYNDKAGR